MMYQKGDTYKLTNYRANGFITSGGTMVEIGIILPKIIKSSSITVQLTKWAIRQNGNYLINNDTTFDTSKFSIATADIHENYFVLKMTATNSSNWVSTPTNNDLVTCTIHGTIAFN